MRKLLATLGLFFLLISPALADHKMLRDGRDYTEYVVTCNTETDFREYMNDVKRLSMLEGRLTEEVVKIATKNNNCVYGIQYFVYKEGEYLCSFSILYYNFAVLQTEKQFLIVPALIVRGYIPCVTVPKDS